jgi:uncharacterized protein (DUF1778 family)
MNANDPDNRIISEIEEQITAGTEFDDLTSVHARRPRNPRAVFSVRLSPDEFAVISRAAANKDAAVSDFIREAAVTTAEYALAAMGKEADLVEVAKSLDALRERVGAALKSNAKARGAS